LPIDRAPIISDSAAGGLLILTIFLNLDNL